MAEDKKKHAQKETPAQTVGGRGKQRPKQQAVVPVK